MIPDFEDQSQPFFTAVSVFPRRSDGHREDPLLFRLHFPSWMKVPQTQPSTITLFPWQLDRQRWLGHVFTWTDWKGWKVQSYCMDQAVIFGERLSETLRTVKEGWILASIKLTFVFLWVFLEVTHWLVSACPEPLIRRASSAGQHLKEPQGTIIIGSLHCHSNAMEWMKSENQLYSYFEKYYILYFFFFRSQSNC